VAVAIAALAQNPYLLNESEIKVENGAIERNDEWSHCQMSVGSRDNGPQDRDCVLPKDSRRETHHGDESMIRGESFHPSKNEVLVLILSGNLFIFEIYQIREIMSSITFQHPSFILHTIGHICCPDNVFI
jgi:hypothetical protein